MTVNGMDPRDEAEDYARDCRAAERKAARRRRREEGTRRPSPAGE